jgi:hypothetical protein
MLQSGSSFQIKTFYALMLTIFTGGLFHLVLVFVSALLGSHASNANPVNFLGISLLAPSLTNSRILFWTLWIALIGLYAAYLVFLVHWRKYLKPLRSMRKIRTSSDESAPLAGE